MVLHDRIYGSVEINESVLIELINSPSLQRLKGISQFGLPDRYYHLKGFSRYEHSIGVMMLLRKFNASLEEQVAGLLHDVSHTAFSHTIDWVVGDSSKENIQDLLYPKFIKSSEINEILQKYRYDSDKISNLENFSLLETEVPNLCADRIDYLLREPSVPAGKILSGLAVRNKRFVAKNKRAAKLLAITFLERQTNHWAGYQSGYRWKLLSIILRRALKKKVITRKDFFRDDAYIINKIKESKDIKLLEDFKILQNKNENKLPILGFTVHKKIRYVDPEFIDETGKIKRFSQTDTNFKNKLDKAIKKMSKGIKV